MAPKVAGEYEVSVVVNDGKGGETQGSIMIAVVLYESNRPPNISVIVTPKDMSPITVTPTHEIIKIRQWSITEIECIAEDPDGDDISIIWSATAGKINGEGAKVLYIPTTRGDHAVTVTISDSTGRQTKGTVYFHVQCCGSG